MLQSNVFPFILLLTVAPPLLANPPSPGASPVQITRLLACKAVSDSAARLNCFDHEASVLAQAIDRKDVVVVDREAIRSTRRSLFGFSVPSFGLFGNDGGTEEVKQIEGVLQGSSSNRDGGYVLALADGSRWSQTDDRPLALEPRIGDKIVVHRAAMGSYMLNVGRQPGIRVKRIN